MSANLVTLVLAAGKGTRMRSPLPKPMLPVGGKPMLAYVLRASNALEPDERHVVIGPQMDVVRRFVDPISCVVQHERRGTGHAVQVAMDAVQATEGTLLVLNGDVPLISSMTLTRLVENHVRAGSAVSVLGFSTESPGSYGRLKVRGQHLSGIVEAKDATVSELDINLCNGGIYAIDIAVGRRLLPMLSDDNAAGELYLTDIVGLANRAGLNCTCVLADELELAGANDLAELTVLDRRVRDLMTSDRKAA